MFYETAQDFLSAVAVKAGDEVDASRPQTFVSFDFDVLTIEEVSMSGSMGRELTSSSSSMKPEEDEFELIGGGVDAHLSERGFRGVYRASGAKHSEEKGLDLVGVSAFVGRRE